MRPPTSPPWVGWAAAAWVLAASLWFFTRDLPGAAGTRAAVAGNLLLVPEQLWETPDGPQTGWAGVLHPWRWAAWGTAAAIWAAAWVSGEIVMGGSGPRRTHRFPGLTPAERVGLRFGLGSALLAFLTLAAGLLGWSEGFGWSIWVFASSLPVSLLWQSEVPGRFWGKLHPSFWLSVPPNAGRYGWVILAVAPFLTLMTLGSTIPTTEFDAREYHLEGPKEWFLAGRVERLPHNVYTQMPAGTEMLTLLCMSLCGDWRVGALAGQATLAGFVPLAGLAAACVARRLFGTGCVGLAAAAFLTSPWAVRLTIHPYAEGALCAYGTLALLAVTIAVRRRRLRSVRPALLAGLLAGAAFACKYPALLMIAAPAGVVLALGGPARRWCKLTAFACGFAAFAAPWLLKNLIETGNPVFPLLWNVFGGTGWDAATDARWAAAHAPPGWSPTRWPHWFGQPLGLDLFHTPLLVAFAPLAGCVAPRRARLLATALGMLLVVWYVATHRIDRFWVPLLPVGCVLAGAGLRWATTRTERPVRVAAWTAAGAGVLFNFALCVGGVANEVPFSADPEAAAAWVAGHSSPFVAALNEQFGPGDVVVLVGEAQVFDARFTPIYATAWNPAPLADPDAPLPDGIAAVAVNWSEITRYRATYGFDSRVRQGFLDARVRRGELRPAEPVTVGGSVIGEIYRVR